MLEDNYRYQHADSGFFLLHLVARLSFIYCEGHEDVDMCFLELVAQPLFFSPFFFCDPNGACSFVALLRHITHQHGMICCITWQLWNFTVWRAFSGCWRLLRHIASWPFHTRTHILTIPTFLQAGSITAKELKECFNALDLDGDGLLSRKELALAVRALGTKFRWRWVWGQWFISSHPGRYFQCWWH